MLEIRNYRKVTTLREAWELNQKGSNLLLGGMLWTRMGNRRVDTAIDLSALALNRIVETDQEFRIGCMVRLRDLETHPGLDRYTNGAMKEALRHIVGVQFRNLATVGGSLFGRFGFSDVLTMFIVMEAKVEFYKAGIVSIREFAGMRPDRDILVRVIIEKADMRFAYRSLRNTETDFPVLTCAGSVEDGGYVRIAFGGRPGRAEILPDDLHLLKDGITDASAEAFTAYARDNVQVGADLRAGAEYRSLLAGVLSKRVLSALKGGTA